VFHVLLDPKPVRGKLHVVCVVVRKSIVNSSCLD